MLSDIPPVKKILFKPKQTKTFHPIPELSTQVSLLEPPLCQQNPETAPEKPLLPIITPFSAKAPDGLPSWIPSFPSNFNSLHVQ